MSFNPKDLTPKDGQNPVLTAPDEIRGKIGRWDSPERRAARIDWLKSLPDTITGRQVAQALKIGEGAGQRLLAQHAPRSARPPNRADIHSRGISFGQLRPEILKLPWSVQDDLEAHCARTGQTIAAVLVEFWDDQHP